MIRLVVVLVLVLAYLVAQAGRPRPALLGPDYWAGVARQDGGAS